MMIYRAYHHAIFDIALYEPGDRVCYVIAPDGLSDDIVKWAGNAAEKLAVNIVVISGLDWNHDMSPWAAAGVMKNEKRFSGGASMFLQGLINDYIPYLDPLFRQKIKSRYLIGISLSGLFAVWSLPKTGVFEGVASISGSLWFDGFAEWIEKADCASSRRVYLSLGVKEKNTKDKRMAKVEECTNRIVSALRGKGLTVALDMVPGTHFSPAVPKVDKALRYLLEENC